MRHLLELEGLEAAVELESAGTGDWHVGDPPDPRATSAARARGVALEGAARRVEPADFGSFDLILAMDADNLAALRRAAPDEAALDRVRRLREFDPAAVAAGDLDVPDPYFGHEDGFERVLDVVEAGCRGLLDELRAAGRV